MAGQRLASLYITVGIDQAYGAGQPRRKSH